MSEWISQLPSGHLYQWLLETDWRSGSLFDLRTNRLIYWPRAWLFHCLFDRVCAKLNVSSVFWLNAITDLFIHSLSMCLVVSLIELLIISLIASFLCRLINSVTGQPSAGLIVTFVTGGYQVPADWLIDNVLGNPNCCVCTHETVTKQNDWRWEERNEQFDYRESNRNVSKLRNTKLRNFCTNILLLLLAQNWGIREHGGKSPHILHRGTRWMWLISFTLWLNQPWGNI